MGDHTYCISSGDLSLRCIQPNVVAMESSLIPIMDNGQEPHWLLLSTEEQQQVYVVNILLCISQITVGLVW